MIQKTKTIKDNKNLHKQVRIELSEDEINRCNSKAFTGVALIQY